MILKCANPACSERFLYLRQGKIFQLTPTPEVEAIGKGFPPSLYERFWLCDKCCKEMTLVWGGTEAKLVPLPAEPGAVPPALEMNDRQKQENKSRTRELNGDDVRKKEAELPVGGTVSFEARHDRVAAGIARRGSIRIERSSPTPDGCG